MRRNNRQTHAAQQRGKPAKSPLWGLPYLCEAEVVEGLEPFAARELARSGEPGTRGVPQDIRQGEGSVQFRYAGDLAALWRLRTVQAVYLLHRFPVPRPLALLGDENLRTLLQLIEVARHLGPAEAYQSFYLAAAGSDSSVMVRIKQVLAQQTGLREAETEGDLLLRIRRPPEGGEGWDVLVRLSPRPLATRRWRVCNFEGALNATIAAAMVLLTEPRAEDVFLNVGCGSGTLLIERLAQGAARRVIGCDTNPEALACARANVQASGFSGQIALEPWDARALPLPDQSITAQCADLPFGHLVGSHEDNLELYPRILQESARVAQPRSLFVVITHEVRLMESLLNAPAEWQLEQLLRVTQRGLHPGIFVLRRR